jgi:TRAP-type mannitol/chloroaromatic compound transport system permease small subunit
MFMMAGAYHALENGHVRGDVLYGFFPPAPQAGSTSRSTSSSSYPRRDRARLRGLDLRGRNRGRHPEHSSVMSDGPPIYSFKTFIPIAGAFLLVQGVVESCAASCA